MSLYSQGFYAQRNMKTRYAAETILSLVTEERPSITSAIDIGCGVGTWLNVLQQRGAHDIQGVDGPWVDKEYLEIPHHCFNPYDFNYFPINLAFQRRFDLAINLEVAEHISPANAGDFIKFLTSLSDCILFSAAIPGQTGRGHVNEQWPSYWVTLFSEQGYHVRDTLRAKIWNDTQIPWWYRQNILFFVAGEEPVEAAVKGKLAVNMGALPVVHPELFNKEKSARQAYRIFVSCLIKAFRRRFFPPERTR